MTISSYHQNLAMLSERMEILRDRTALILGHTQAKMYYGIHRPIRCPSSLRVWQTSAAKQHHIEGSYGTSNTGFTYIASATPENLLILANKIKTGPSHKWLEEFVEATQWVDTVPPERKLPTREIPADSIRADIHLLTEREENEETLAALGQDFRKYLASISLDQPVKLRSGGYTSIKLDPSRYRDVAHCNFLYSIRPAGKLTLR